MLERTDKSTFSLTNARGERFVFRLNAEVIFRQCHFYAHAAANKSGNVCIFDHISVWLRLIARGSPSRGPTVCHPPRGLCGVRQASLWRIHTQARTFQGPAVAPCSSSALLSRTGSRFVFLAAPNDEMRRLIPPPRAAITDRSRGESPATLCYVYEAHYFAFQPGWRGKKIIK